MTDEDDHRERVRDIIEEDRDILDALADRAEYDIEYVETDPFSEDDALSNEDVIERTRELVYDGDELIEPDELDPALEAAGVGVGETSDGVSQYWDVPDDISLTAAKLAVTTRKDPSEFIFTGDLGELEDRADDVFERGEYVTIEEHNEERDDDDE